jgi:hypothetical protein
MDDGTSNESGKAEGVGPSGVPSPGGLVASRNEAIALGLAILGVALLIFGFWYEAGR